MNTAIILAGGFGTRLQSVIQDVPKPMAPVCGEPFLNYQLKYLRHFGIHHVILSVGHLHDKIISFYRDSFQGMSIDYVIETEPMGTGGGIRLAFEKCSHPQAYVLNGDSFFDVDLHHYSETFHALKATHALATRKVEDAARYGTIASNKQQIVSFREKNGIHKSGIINGGVYMLQKEHFMSHTPAKQNFSIEKDFFEKQVQNCFIAGIEYNSYFIDIGIPEDYQKAQHDFERFKY
jgi:D-glycero-alpha-D-manno-heptose 1-phosphate guanylyltransferase